MQGPQMHIFSLQLTECEDALPGNVRWSKMVKSVTSQFLPSLWQVNRFAKAEKPEDEQKGPASGATNTFAQDRNTRRLWKT